MPYSEEKKLECLALLEAPPGGQGMSARAIGRQLGISPTTVKKWADEAGVVIRADGPQMPTEASDVAAFLLRKARKMAAGMETMDTKSRMENATAIEKAVNAYLKLNGVAESPENATQVNINISELLR